MPLYKDSDPTQRPTWIIYLPQTLSLAVCCHNYRVSLPCGLTSRLMQRQWQRKNLKKELVLSVLLKTAIVLRPSTPPCPPSPSPVPQVRDIWRTHLSQFWFNPPLSQPLSFSFSTVNLTYTDGASGGEVSPRTSRNIKSHFRRKKFQSPQLRSSLEAILQPSPSSLVSDLLWVRYNYWCIHKISHTQNLVNLLDCGNSL